VNLLLLAPASSQWLGWTSSPTSHQELLSILLNIHSQQTTKHTSAKRQKNCINRQEGTTGKPLQNITNHHKLGQIVAN